MHQYTNEYSNLEYEIKKVYYHSKKKKFLKISFYFD